MIKLQDLLNEQEQFKAKSKETGRVVVYKSKENMDKAIKAGAAEPLDKKTGDKPEKVKGQDMFSKDLEKEKPQDSGKNSAREDRLQASKIVRMSSHGNKIFFNENPEKYAEQLEQTLLDIQDHADKMNDEDMSDEFYSESEELAMQVSDIANSGEDMSFDDFKQARLFIKDYENALTKNKQSKPTASIGYRTGKNRMGGMYDGVIKLADLIKEGKVWERKFGEPLPTLNSVMEKHQQNQLNESPISVLKPARVEKKSIVYGYITLQPYYNQIRKTWKDLKKLLDRIDYVAIDFDDRNESLSAVTNLPGWKDPFIREPMIKSFRNFTKFVNNPKNMKDPKRVQNAIKKNIRQSALPKWIQLTKLYKQYLKFNNKKISSVFPETKGKKIGEKRIGDFGGFTLTEDVHKLFTNQSGFTQTNMRDAFESMDWLIKNRYKKMIVQGPRD